MVENWYPLYSLPIHRLRNFLKCVETFIPICFPFHPLISLNPEYALV
jgi:hypothetical protein